MLPLVALVAFVAPASPPRALWVWGGERIVDDPVAQTQFLLFLKAPHGDAGKAIGTVFLAYPVKALPRIGGFLRKAHAQGLKVDYLCGDKHFALPEEHEAGLRLLDAVVSFNGAAPADARFDGFQYDVEPYLLEGWPSKALTEGFLGFLEGAGMRAKGLRLGAAIPRWFDADEFGGLYRSVIDRVEYAAIMDYVDNPAWFVEGGAKEIAYCGEKGKTAWLGAETQNLPDEPRVTFFAKGRGVMETAFSDAATAYGSGKGFAGVAIHDYASYFGMAK